MGAVSAGRLRRKLEVCALSEVASTPAAFLLLLLLLTLLRFPAWTLLCERLRASGCIAADVVAVAVAAATNGGAVVAAVVAAATTTVLLASNRVDT